MPLKTTLLMMRSIKRGSQIKITRSINDFFADRIIQAMSEPTLLDAIERMAKTMNSSIDSAGKKLTADFLVVAGSNRANDVLIWLRKHPRIAAMIAALDNDREFNEAISAVSLPESRDAHPSVVQTHPSYDVGISVELLSPLAHGAEGKAGNATIFRRRQVISPDGAILELPFYAGNAIRGQIRDLLADHFLQSLGISPRRDKPPVALWFFHTLYAGGILEEQSKAIEAISRELGKNGALRTDGLRQIRNMIPPVSLLGAAIGNKILPGRIYVNDLRPHCFEWGTGYAPVSEIMEWAFLTRRDDYEGRTAEDAHNGMIANTECIKAGVTLSGGIDMDTHIGEMEKSALGCGLDLFQKRGFLGAENRRGMGKARIVLSNAPDKQPYIDWIENNKSGIVHYLMTIGAIHASSASDRASDIEQQ